MANTFQQDVDFLARHTQTLILGDPETAALVMAPEYQGRIMTSTAGGTSKSSFGWINYDLIQSGEIVPQINLYGGEERFWLAPEGGRHSIFFPPASLNHPLEFQDWRVPKCIDTEPFLLLDHDDRQVQFQHHARVTNRSGYEFQIHFDRRVELLGNAEICQTLNCEESDLKNLNTICHQSRNRLVNTGPEIWQPETGLLSVWVLCMNSPSRDATLVVPFRSGAEQQFGSIVNADYFGKLERDRLWIDRDRNLIFLKGDGEFRSKLGLTWERACSILGAWDADRRVLTVVWYNLPDRQKPESWNGVYHSQDQVHYVNNLWQVVDHEYHGDVVNGYNDGPNESGDRLGGFFELESLSPALALEPSQGYEHIHRTIRLQAGDENGRENLDRLAKRVFGIDLAGIESVFA